MSISMDQDETTFLLIRHGETDWNRDHRLQGQSNDSTLTEKGKTQAGIVGRQLISYIRGREVILWSSDLSRATETAQIIAHKIGYPVSKIMVDPRLREANHGKFEGLKSEQYKDDPDYQARKTKSSEEKFTIAMDPIHGESGAKVAIRAQACLMDIAKAYPTAINIIITHGGVINSLRKSITGNFDFPDAKNGEVVVLKKRQGKLATGKLEAPKLTSKL